MNIKRKLDLYVFTAMSLYAFLFILLANTVNINVLNSIIISLLIWFFAFTVIILNQISKNYRYEYIEYYNKKFNSKVKAEAQVKMEFLFGEIVFFLAIILLFISIFIYIRLSYNTIYPLTVFETYGFYLVIISTVLIMFFNVVKKYCEINNLKKMTYYIYIFLNIIMCLVGLIFIILF